MCFLGTRLGLVGACVCGWVGRWVDGCVGGCANEETWGELVICFGLEVPTAWVRSTAARRVRVHELFRFSHDDLSAFLRPPPLNQTRRLSSPLFAERLFFVCFAFCSVAKKRNGTEKKSNEHERNRTEPNGIQPNETKPI